MAKQRDPKKTRFALAVVVLIAVALLFLSGCAYVVVPNNMTPATVMPLTFSEGMPLDGAPSNGML
jgi:hypothetical protein